MLARLTALAAVAVFLCLTPASAQTPPAPPPAGQPALPFVLTEIAPGVYAAIDGPEGKSGSNAGFVIGEDAVAVIDSFFDPAAAKALLGEIRRLTDKPVRYVVNTHYHIDHTGGDQVFKDAGATIVAHRNVRAWIHSENIHLFGDRITPALKAQAEALAEPDRLVTAPLVLKLGERRIEIRPVEGHTGGDLVVAVPDANVLFCGDMVWNRVSPNLIDGTVSKWIRSVDGFFRLPGAMTMSFVPGHGPLAGPKDVHAFGTYLKALRELTADALKRGLGGEALVADVVPRLKARFGDWKSFDRAAPREVRYMEAELTGTKRVPTPAT